MNFSFKKFLIRALLFLIICITFSFFFNEVTVKIPLIGTIIAKNNLIIKQKINTIRGGNTTNSSTDSDIYLVLKERLKDERLIEAKTKYYLNDKLIGESLINENNPISILKIKFPSNGNYKIYYERREKSWYYRYDRDDRQISDEIRRETKDIIVRNIAEYEVEFIDLTMFPRRINSSLWDDYIENVFY